MGQVSEPAGMFAIVDLTSRASRGKILMLLDDEDTAQSLAGELASRAVNVVVRPLTAEELRQVRTSFVFA